MDSILPPYNLKVVISQWTRSTNWIPLSLKIGLENVQQLSRWFRQAFAKESIQNSVSLRFVSLWRHNIGFSLLVNYNWRVTWLYQKYNETYVYYKTLLIVEFKLKLRKNQIFELISVTKYFSIKTQTLNNSFMFYLNKYMFDNYVCDIIKLLSLKKTLTKQDLTW